jgi:lycopene beta-cyclase
MRECDLPILIAGAGCAGLSLAVELGQRDYPGEIIIVDPRTEYGRDRTWCHYLTRGHSFESCISHRWHRWRVRTDRGEAVASSNLYPYVQISSGRFYSKALKSIRSTPTQTLKLGVSVQSIEPGSDSVRVTLSDGSTRQVACVFDSRPNVTEAAATPDVTLFQQFAGLRVATAHDAFTPDTTEMMDFRLPQCGSIRFIYLLPYSTREALVEATIFTEKPVDPCILKMAVLDYLKERCAVGHIELIHSEYGCIPMSTARMEARTHPRVIRIGLAGGAVKPSTGYAFGAIQQASARLADELSAGVSPSNVSTPHYRPRRSTFLDDVFLCYLSKHSEKAAEIFRGIFQSCSGDRIARFLTDSSTVADDLHIIAAMPKLPFMLEAFRSFQVWSRAA